MILAITEFVEGVEGVVDNAALLVAYLIEIFGIIVILVGAVKSFYLYFAEGLSKKPSKHNIKIELGNFLALGLEFKMGAEILKTVVVRTTTELIILGAIIVLRAILAVLIHWEVKNEKAELEGSEVKEHTFLGIGKKKEKEEKKVEE